MCRVPCLLLGLLGLVAAFNPLTDDITIDMARNHLNMTLKYEKYIPAVIVNEIKDLLKPENTPELQNMVDLHNKFRNGELNITMPHTRSETMEIMKQYAPKTYERFARIMKDFDDKLNSMSSEAKKFCEESEVSYYSMQPNSTTDNNTLATQITNQIKYFVDQDAKFRALPDSVKAEFQKNWPELMALYNSPMYQQMINIMKSADPEQIGTLIHKMMTVASDNEQN